MTIQLTIQPTHPQPRLIQQSIQLIREGAVFAYPTDSSYALGCIIGDKAAMDRIRQIRQLNDQHNFTLVCRDLSEISTYAKVDKQEYRLLKNHTPGAYTFILEATRELPRRLMHPKRKTIGLRIPDSPIVQALLAELNQPLLSLTFSLPDMDAPIAEVADISTGVLKQLDLVIDGGYCGIEATSVIDLTNSSVRILRRGKADVSNFEGLS